MKESGKLRIYCLDGHDLESASNQNRFLENNYKISLFDMAYLLAISLNGEFMPKNERRIYLGRWEELNKAKQLLLRTKAKLPSRSFYSRLVCLIEEYLESINRGLEITRLRPGRGLNTRTKLVLLWAYILRRKDMIPFSDAESIAETRLREELHGIQKSIDWGDYHKLTRWFYLKLNNCSYAALFLPNENARIEIKKAKSLLEKHVDSRSKKKKAKSLCQEQVSSQSNTKNWNNAKSWIWVYISVQRLLSLKGGRFLDCRKRIKNFAEPSPIVLVKFNQASIEIGRKTAERTIVRRYTRLKNDCPRIDEVGKSELEIEYPTIVFPDGEVFKSRYYRPPFHHFGGSLPEDIWEPRRH